MDTSTARLLLQNAYEALEVMTTDGWLTASQESNNLMIPAVASDLSIVRPREHLW